MTEGIMYRFRARTRSAESVLGEFESWKEEHAEAMAVRDLEGWIVDAMEATQGAMDMLVDAGKTGVPSSEDGPARFGQAGLGLYDSIVELLELVQGAVTAAVGHGYEVAGAEELQVLLGELKTARVAFARRWPTDLGLWNQATADIQAGRVHTLQGVRDELRRRRAGSNP